MKGFLSLLFGRRFEAVRCRGPSRWSAGELTLVYLGKGESLAWLKALLFAAEPASEVLGRYNLLELCCGFGSRLAAPVRVRELTHPLARLLRWRAAWTLADWVESTLDLHGDWTAVLARFRRSTVSRDLPRVERCGFTTEIAIGKDVLNDFYERLYLPLMTQRHGEAGVIVGRDWLLARAASHRLFRVLHGGRCVAAAFFTSEGEELNWILVGMATDFDLPERRHLLAALYLGMIRHAHDNGHTLLRLGTTRPLLRDGVYLHKRKWGARVETSPQSETRLLFDCELADPHVRQWLQACPFIVAKAHDLRVLAFCFTPSALDGVLGQIRESLTPGLQGIDLVTDFGIGSLPETIEDLPVERVTLKTFAGRIPCVTTPRDESCGSTRQPD